MNKLIIGLVLLLAQSALGLNLLEINRLSRTLFGEYEASRSYYPDSVFNPLINMGQAMIAHVGKAVERETTIVLLNGVRKYRLPSDFDGTIAVISHVRADRPTYTFITWDLFTKGLANAGDLQYTVANGKLFLHPKPNIPATGGDSILVVYYATVTPMSSDTATCRLPDYWQYLLPQITFDLLQYKKSESSALLEAITGKIVNFRREHLDRASVKEGVTAP